MWLFVIRRHLVAILAISGVIWNVDLLSRAARAEESSTVESVNLEHGLSESRKELSLFLAKLPKEFRSQYWYGTVDDNPLLPAKCGHSVKDEKGNTKPDRLALIEGDINNDGAIEYVLLSRCNGPTEGDKIIEVFQKKASRYVSLDFTKVLKNGGIDGNLVRHIDGPFLVQNNGNVEMHFKSPTEVWLWKGRKLRSVIPK